MRSLFQFNGIFAFISCILIPFSWSLLWPINELQKFVLLPITRSIADFLGITYTLTDLSSDSTLFVLIYLLSFLISIPVSWWLSKRPMNKQKRIEFLQISLTLFLSIVLFKYGLDKVFKQQFFFPEPNTLNTRLGYLDKDILYWSTIGSSYLYNVITGSLEVITAILLLSNKLRRTGVILSLFILSNIALINFSFDISVKFFSLQLLITALFLFTFEINKADKKSLKFRFQVLSLSRNASLVCIFVILTEGLYPYLINQNFNDDLAIKPSTYGTYHVINPKGSIDQICVHSDGFIIFMDNGIPLNSYRMSQNIFDKSIEITGYEDHEHLFLKVKKENNTRFIFEISNLNKGKSIVLSTEKENISEYPLNKQKVHYTVD